ncbi:hypothetical protein KX928_22905 [Roseobacter sp. YSTF-M11]|uniref:Uncharacterized protein n=1 Tax=Roseobacter insulae TaxID=2859783 RepID=A0A9X1FZM3_9RHOB|nr:hypothetical protein [Roseobacter insulae]MBW4710649.1 hypothetical protein [Roseobacter insulae]
MRSPWPASLALTAVIVALGAIASAGTAWVDIRKTRADPCIEANGLPTMRAAPVRTVAPPPTAPGRRP